MKRWTGRMVMVGVVSGGLFATGCLQDDSGGPHTPIQEKYQPGAAEAAQDLNDNRQGLDMPDWQNHPTMEEDEEDWRARREEAADLDWTPTVPPPDEAYETAGDVLAPRADEDAPDVEVPEEGIGGAGGTEPIQRPEERR